MNEKHYYNIEDDFKKYPDAWCYIIVGGNSTGKTYGTLWYEYKNNRRFAFVKRTNDDVDILCATNRRVDLSPFKAINRDKKIDVGCSKVTKGIGAFYNRKDGEVDGEPIGYVMSLNAVGSVKGFDVSDIKDIVFDEFIPQPWERTDRKEGDKTLVLYRTISRDREHRGEEPLRLICLANATKINNPLFETLELTDTVALMKEKGEVYNYDRGIMIHLLDDMEEFRNTEEKTQIMQAMKNTDWGRMALDNDFAYDDFSCVGHTSIKGYKPLYGFSYKNKTWYVYNREQRFYICKSKADVFIYDLSREIVQQDFYRQKIIDLKTAMVEDRVICCDYTSYNIIFNYKKYFVI